MNKIDTLKLKESLLALSNLPANADFTRMVDAAGLDPRCDLKHFSFVEQDFSGCDLGGYNFTGADLTNATFDHAKIIGAIFRGARVSLDQLSRASDVNDTWLEQVRDELASFPHNPDVVPKTVPNRTLVRKKNVFDQQSKREPESSTAQERMASMPKPKWRPARVTELLAHPVAVNPEKRGAKNDKYWVQEHGGMKRFYVHGLEWFFKVSRLSRAAMGKYCEEAIWVAHQQGWPGDYRSFPSKGPNLSTEWDRFSKIQISNAANWHPVSFVKACLIILACELAMQDLVDQREDAKAGTLTGKKKKDAFVSPQIKTGGDVYSQLKIVPAVWNIDDFNRSFMEALVYDDPATLRKLMRHVGQPERTLDDLANGHTVTYQTAKKIREFFEVHPDLAPNPLGIIRIHAGRKRLGTKKASEAETVTLVLNEKD